MLNPAVHFVTLAVAVCHVLMEPSNPRTSTTSNCSPFSAREKQVVV